MVSDLVISPEVVNVGQLVTISCVVTNIGSESGSYGVVLGGDFMAQKNVTLAPGESQVISFEVTPSVAKTYNVSVNGLSGSFVATEPAMADIQTENLVIEPAELYVGETVLITVTVTNYGDAAGSKVIKCTVT